VGRVPVKVTAKNGEVYNFSTHFEGLVNLIKRRYEETDSESMKEEYEKLMRRVECPVCHGKRLKKEALAVTVDGLNIAELTSFLLIEHTNSLLHLKTSSRRRRSSSLTRL